MMNATCGAKCYEQFKKLNRDSSLLKMSLVSRILMGDWYSSRCALTWKMKGTKFSRLLFQLQPKTLRTEEIDAGSLELGMLPTITASFGERGGNLNPESNHDTEKAMRVAIPKLMMLLKTPCSADAYTENLTKKEQRFGNSGTLAQEVQTGFIYQRGMLPTPTASDVEGGVSNPNQISQKNGRYVRTSNNTGTEFGAKLRDVVGMLPTPTVMDSTNATATMKSTQVKEGSMHSVTLTRAMGMGMLPTPQAQEGEKITGKENQDSMTKRVRETTGQTSQLNPRFVAEMMGFPTNWTELPFQNGEQNQSKDMATP
jgi:hypothetical protein